MALKSIYHSAIAREGEPILHFVFRQVGLVAGPIDLDSVLRALQTRTALVRKWELFGRPTSGRVRFVFSKAEPAQNTALAVCQVKGGSGPHAPRPRPLMQGRSHQDPESYQKSVRLALAFAWSPHGSERPRR